MKERIIGPYRIAVDVEATRTYYAAHPLPWITCQCSGCRNFVRAVKTLPPAVTEFFTSLGLDVEKAAETMYYTGTPQDVYGGGWYHLRGAILEGGPWNEGLPPEAWVEIAPDFSVAFQQECALLPEDFPPPCVQMEVDYRLPWLLDEKNDYIYED